MDRCRERTQARRPAAGDEGRDGAGQSAYARGGSLTGSRRRWDGRGDRGAPLEQAARGVGARVDDRRGVERPSGFPIVPQRRVVERTVAWLSTWRRLARDDELLSSRPGSVCPG